MRWQLIDGYLIAIFAIIKMSEAQESKGPQMIVGPDGVERSKNEHKKYLAKLEKEKKK